MKADQREIQRKLGILKLANETGSDIKICRYFGVGKSTFYRWRELLDKHGEQGLINRLSIPKQHSNRTPLKVYEKHMQANAIDFVEYLIEKFPFRIKEIRTDNGHEFQA